MDLPDLNLEHLKRLTGPHGLFEHAEYSTPRVELGYTTDDNARALVVMSRALDPAEMAEETPRYLDFVVRGRTPFGWHNRMSRHGEWVDRRGSDDAHGRALWGLGSVIAAGVLDPDGVAAFIAGLDLDTVHIRSNCYAVLGAAEVAESKQFPTETEATLEAFLDRAVERLPRGRTGVWAWPEPTLTYDNARLPHALLAAGSALDEPGLIDDGLRLLDWLVGVEMSKDGWFSFTPTAGRGPGQTGPAFDQQPIEAWGMADACLAASRLDGSGDWITTIEEAAFWFLGHNDAGAHLYDPETGGGFDGLESGGVNLNQGAESTLAALGALQALDDAGAWVSH
jgi:hypothetical protein